MRAFLIAPVVWASLISGQAQEAPKPEITVEQIMNKAIEAAGGRAAMEKMTSYIATGPVEISALGITANNETYAKAPDKRLSVTTIEGLGEIVQGCDGKVAWSKEPHGGLKEITGDMAEQTRREAVFSQALEWKTLYPQSEVTGKDKSAGGRECWMVKLTPAKGRPVMHCYDTESFLLTKAVNPGPNGSDIPVEFSDYKDTGVGVKAPMTIKVAMPNLGEMTIRYREVKPNAEIDDARFKKPAE
jgi:outer membrane lipoprotein-sorting protein